MVIGIKSRFDEVKVRLKKEYKTKEHMQRKITAKITNERPLLLKWLSVLKIINL